MSPQIHLLRLNALHPFKGVMPFHIEPFHLQRMRSDLRVHQRSRVALPRIRSIIADREDRNTRRDNNRPIHARRTFNLRCRRPEAEEDQQAKVAARHDVVDRAQGALEPPRTPRQTTVLRFVRGCAEGHDGVLVGIEIAAGATPEEQSDGEEVGDVEAFENKRDGAVEGGIVADVDESQESRKGGYDDYGCDWDRSAFVNLVKSEQFRI
jgi:hypothetical protein